jgi:hypothetical protein
MLNLPDELLLMILNKLNTISLICLFNIHPHLNELILMELCQLNLFMTSTNGINPIEDNIIVKFFMEILPQIHQRIQYVNIQSTLLEKIFLIHDYPNLKGMEFFNVTEQIAVYLFSSLFQMIDYFYSIFSSV